MKIEIPEQKKPVHEMLIPIRWGDMDANGHVNNATYFRYLETARITWFTSIGYGPDRDRLSIIIANAFCNFVRQLEYPGDIRIRTHVGTPGRSSFDIFATLERSDQPGIVCATGGVTAVWFDYQTGRAAPLPETLRQRLIG